MFDLHGRVAVITGASSGLGRQFALALAGQGADIVLLARRMEKLDAVAQEVRTKGVKCLPVKCDICELDDIKAAVKATIDEFGKVDILVNNAGGGLFYPSPRLPMISGSTVLTLSSPACSAASASSAKEMIKAGYGRIINNASLFGRIGTGEIAISNYCAVKGGVVNLTREVACELCKHGITCNCVQAGFFPRNSTAPRHGNARTVD